jgi:hypothetical protein
VGIKTFFGAVAREPSIIGKTTCYHLLLNLFILIMGKSKDITTKEIMPSTTRGGTNLPSRPNFSHVAASAIKNKSAALHSPPLSKMSMTTDTDNKLSDDSVDDEVTNNSSNPSSNKNSELDKETAKSNAIKALSPKSIAAFSRAFVEGSLSDFDEFDYMINAALGDYLYPINKKIVPIVYIKDPDYEFSINPEIIELVEKNKFYGNDEVYPGDHKLQVHKLANLYGNKDKMKQYYVVKLFPFSLKGDARNWYNALPPKSITSKDSCIQYFMVSIFPLVEYML